MDDKNIKDYIDFFKNSLLEYEYKQIETNNKNIPQSPMMVVYMDDEVAKTHDILSNSLFKIWPAYKSKLLFVKNTSNNEKITFTEIGRNIMDCVHLDEKKLLERVENLFGVESHFVNNDNFFVYFIIGTEKINNQEDFLHMYKNMEKIIEAIKGSSPISVLFLLMKEGITRKEQSKKIKNLIAEKIFLPTYLMSNLRSDNVIMENWHTCYKIIADIIALSNSSYVNRGKLISGGVKNIGYSCVEKPIESIGQIVVTQMLLKLNESQYLTGNNQSVKVDGLEGKLGLSKEGTFDIFDRYVDNNLINKLPPISKLELFPRLNMSEFTDLSGMPAKRFDDLTLGAWKSYLDKLINEEIDAINNNIQKKSRLENEFSKCLIENFSVDELISMRNNMNEIDTILSNNKTPSNESTIYEAAGKYIKYAFSHNFDMRKFLKNIVLKQSELVKQYKEYWKKLIKSRENLFPVTDENIIQFYDRRVLRYFDVNEYNINSEFKSIKNINDLDAFIKKRINDFIYNDEVLLMPFEEELKERLKDTSDPRDAKEYIRNQLTGDSIKKYLQTSISMGNPIASVLLLNQNTSIYEDLKENMPKNVSYYNTGYNGSAEAIEIYNVDRINLMS